jgi:hypothetical protein
MKLSKLIETLTIAQASFGDVTVNLLDHESGDWTPLQEVIKLHPYTGPYGSLNREESVNGIGFARTRGNVADLILAKT